MKQYSNFIIVSVFTLIAVSVATADLFMNRDVSGAPAVGQTRVEAATITYRRTIRILPPGSADIPQLPTATPIQVPPAADTNITEQPEAPPIDPFAATATPKAAQSSQESSPKEPTPTLPGAGWTQVASILFIASSTVIFLSFLF